MYEVYIWILVLGFRGKCKRAIHLYHVLRSGYDLHGVEYINCVQSLKVSNSFTFQFLFNSVTDYWHHDSYRKFT